MILIRYALAGALAAAVTAAPLPARAEDGASPDLLTAAERARQAELRDKLKAWEATAQRGKSPLVAAGLDALLPGAGTYYASDSASNAMGTTFAAVLADAAAAGVLYSWVLPQLNGGAKVAPTNLQLGLTLGLTHLVVGSFCGASQAGEFNKTLPARIEVATRDLRAELAGLNALDAKRERAADSKVAEAQDWASKQLWDFALRSLDTPALAGDSRVPLLRREYEAAREAHQRAYDERDARDKAFRAKRAQEQWQAAAPAAAAAARGQNYEQAIGLLQALSAKDLPADVQQKVADLIAQNEQDEARAGGREKLRRDRAASEARAVQKRANAIEQALLKAVAAGNRSAASRHLAEYDVAGESGSVRGRALLFADAASRLKRGAVRAGEPLVMQCQVETVTREGLVVVVQNAVGGIMNYIAKGYGFQPDETPTRVFVRTRGTAGVVDGDRLTLGVRTAGTYSYTTVLGARATVRAVDLTMRLE